jgi:SAM-dependent methyltransferase
MNPNKALWEKGDFTRLARNMRRSGEALIESIDVRPAMKVLDLGCGDGTTAIPAAQTGAEVLGVDIAANLVAAGNRRAQELGLANVRFEEGDATDLKNLADRRFDLVVSIFGAMFAPKPFDVAKEMVRVTKPGGRIVMGNWIPNDPTLVAQILKISSAYSPPPPEGFVSPDDLGRRYPCARPLCRGRHPEGRGRMHAGHLHVRLRRHAGRIRRRVPRLLRADDERVRRRREERPGRRSAGRARGPLQEPEQERPRRPHDDRRHLPARDGRGALSGGASA